MRRAAVFLFVILAGCAGMNMTQRITIACEGYASTLNTLTAYSKADRLSAEQEAVVDQWEPILTSACLGNPSDVSLDLLDTVEDGLFELIETRRSVE